MPIATQEMLTRVRATGPDALRARGEHLEGTYVYADGSSFGGFGGALPTRRKLAPHLRILDWLRGRRGYGRVEYAVHREQR